MNYAERARHSKTLEDITQELRDMIRLGGWEYPDAHSLLCDTYKLDAQILQDAYDQSELAGVDEL